MKFIIKIMKFIMNFFLFHHQNSNHNFIDGTIYMLYIFEYGNDSKTGYEDIEKEWLETGKNKRFTPYLYKKGV